MSGNCDWTEATSGETRASLLICRLQAVRSSSLLGESDVAGDGRIAYLSPDIALILFRGLFSEPCTSIDLKREYSKPH